MKMAFKYDSSSIEIVDGASVTPENKVYVIDIYNAGVFAVPYSPIPGGDDRYNAVLSRLAAHLQKTSRENGRGLLYYTDDEAGRIMSQGKGEIEMERHLYVDATPYGGAPCWLKFIDDYRAVDNLSYQELVKMFKEPIDREAFSMVLPFSKDYIITCPDGKDYPACLTLINDYRVDGGSCCFYSADITGGASEAQPRYYPIVLDGEGGTFMTISDVHGDICSWDPTDMSWFYFTEENLNDGTLTVAAKGPVDGREYTGFRVPIKREGDEGNARPCVYWDTGLRQKINRSIDVWGRQVASPSWPAEEHASLDNEAKDAQEAVQRSNVQGKDAPAR
jgi:hypothetical protein